VVYWCGGCQEGWRREGVLGNTVEVSHSKGPGSLGRCKQWKWGHKGTSTLWTHGLCRITQASTINFGMVHDAGLEPASALPKGPFSFQGTVTWN
jgi:hypothetical protein